MEAQDARVVLVTTPEEKTARAIGRVLVEERLVACASITTGIASIYRWHGALEEASEALLILKTSAAHMPTLTARIIDLHPYDVPEVLALAVTDGHPAYLSWLAESLRKKDGEADGT